MSPNEAAAGKPSTIRFSYAPHAAVSMAKTEHFDVGRPKDTIDTNTSHGLDPAAERGAEGLYSYAKTHQRQPAS